MGKKKKIYVAKSYWLWNYSIQCPYNLFMLSFLCRRDKATKKERKKERKDSMIVDFLIVHIYQSIIFEKERINNDKVAAKSY